MRQTVLGDLLPHYEPCLLFMAFEPLISCGNYYRMLLSVNVVVAGEGKSGNSFHCAFDDDSAFQAEPNRRCYFYSSLTLDALPS